MSVGMFVCEFNTKHFELAFFDQMDITLPDEVLNAVPKRKAEFLAGRYSVKQLANVLKIPEGEACEVRIGRHRAPIWPSGLKGSITHNASMAICLMSGCERVCSLGIDVESVISEELMGDIANQVCCEQEVQLMLSQGFNKREAITLIFSAKESIFKAFYPKVGEYFDFDKATLKGGDLSGGHMRFQLKGNFARKHLLPNLVDVDFMVNNEIAVTAVILCNTEYG